MNAVTKLTPVASAAKQTGDLTGGLPVTEQAVEVPQSRVGEPSHQARYLRKAKWEVERMPSGQGQNGRT